MLGFLFQWPTLVTLIMFPILVTMYVKLARPEEKEILAEFGEEYRRYMISTPVFCPCLGGGVRTNGHELLAFANSRGRYMSKSSAPPPLHARRLSRGTMRNIPFLPLFGRSTLQFQISIRRSFPSLRGWSLDEFESARSSFFVKRP